MWSRCEKWSLAELFHVFISFVTIAMQALLPSSVCALLSTVLSLLSLSLLLLLCVIKKKRKMEGKYRPRKEEHKQTGAACPEKPGLPLPLPKEERLIWLNSTTGICDPCGHTWSEMFTARTLQLWVMHLHCGRCFADRTDLNICFHFAQTGYGPKGFKYFHKCFFFII